MKETNTFWCDVRPGEVCFEQTAEINQTINLQYNKSIVLTLNEMIKMHPIRSK